jgi:putative PIG3 family NAD(P)H quinone oxidoreductase
MATMRQVYFAGAGGPEVIGIREVPVPEPAGTDVRVRVRAAGLNRADLLQRIGRYPAPAGWPADVPGLEFSGEVDAVGPDVDRWRPGARVMGLVAGGAQSELLTAHESELMPVPDTLDDAGAAAVPEVWLTGFDALHARGRLQAGERLLVHAVGSGVGTAAVQLAKMAGAVVIGTSRTPDKLARAAQLGLDVGIVTGTDGFRAQLREPVDVILDILGAPAFADNLAVLAPRGRLVLLGFLQGASGELDLDPILRKRLEVIGTVMRTRNHAERTALVRDFASQVLPALGEGRLLPVVDQVLPMSRVREAHELLAANRTFGKIVLTW